VIDLDASLCQQLLHVPVRQAVAQIPAHRTPPIASRSSGTTGRAAVPESLSRAGTATRESASSPPATCSRVSCIKPRSGSATRRPRSVSRSPTAMVTSC
jgi:hypothetical protein